MSKSSFQSKSTFFVRFFLVLCIVLAGFAGASDAFGQIGRKMEPEAPKPAETETKTTTEPNTPAGNNPPANPGTTPPAAPTSSLTRDDLVVIVREEVNSLAFKDSVAEIVLPTVVEQISDNSGWHYGLLFGFVAVLVVVGGFIYVQPRRKQIAEMVRKETKAAMVDSSCTLRALAEMQKVRWSDVQNKASELRAADISGGRTTPILLACLLGFASVAQAQICYNVETGKIPGSQRVPVAVWAEENTFACTISGDKVELVDPETPATVVLTPTVTKKSPLEFKFTPMSDGIALVRVDGKVYDRVWVRSLTAATAFNDAVDFLAGRSASGTDTHVRLVLEGLCGDSGPTFKQDAWGNKKGSSMAAGVACYQAMQRAMVDEALGDPRLKDAMQAALAAFAANMPAPAAQAQAGPAFDPTPVYTRLTTVEGDVRSVNNRVTDVVGQQREIVGRLTTVQETSNQALSLSRVNSLAMLDKLSDKGGSNSPRCKVFRQLRETGKLELEGKAKELEAKCK